MILLIIIHILSAPSPTPKTLDSWASPVTHSGFPPSDDLFPRYFANPAFSVTHRQMPSMEKCEKAAKFGADETTLLYCVDVGTKP